MTNPRESAMGAVEERPSVERRIRGWVQTAVARTLGRTPLTATMVTLAGLFLVFGASALIAAGWLFWAGCLVAFASAFDALDGALARAKGEAGPLGAFLDSTLDRYAEAAVFFGVLLHFQWTDAGGAGVPLSFVAFVGAMMTPYARARAEALGYDGGGGLLGRPGRIVLLVAGLVVGQFVGGALLAALWALVALTHVTALGRLVHVARQGKRPRT